MKASMKMKKPWIIKLIRFDKTIMCLRLKKWKIRFHEALKQKLKDKGVDYATDEMAPTKEIGEEKQVESTSKRIRLKSSGRIKGRSCKY
ncbi:hypothetical protein GOBAR_AA31440 [Gossypium barbadense]|uniref:Uncharacterized protein n=1 Tax=Gossypium barbadense TaxID=3634 RepID=A0A2P5WDR4_GOSBA|nr:hypothetical protein GOBAR_AA31440 [Gossypium barbadense]